MKMANKKISRNFDPDIQSNLFILICCKKKVQIDILFLKDEFFIPNSATHKSPAALL